MSEDVVVLTDANFDAEVIQIQYTCIGRFLGSMVWPVQATCAGVIDELVKEYKGKVKIGKT